MANVASLHSWSSEKDLASAAVYDDGHWTLVITRPLDTNPNEKWAPDSVHQIAFAAWSGRNNDTGLKRSSSEWLDLHLGQSAAHHE
jgi:DMSO reductase family type II enzyme heme b subunit